MSDELRRALEAVARDDERIAAVQMSPRLRQEFRRLYRATSRSSRWFGYALAATLLGALGWPLWWTTTHLAVGESAARRASREVMTSFLPLTYGPVPMTDGRIIRIEVPRRSLAAFGLLSAEDSSEGPGTVLADVVVGEDGLARAVRFVRAATPTSD
jgi:hypothetical protein